MFVLQITRAWLLRWRCSTLCVNCNTRHTSNVQCRVPTCTGAIPIPTSLEGLSHHIGFDLRRRCSILRITLYQGGVLFLHTVVHTSHPTCFSPSVQHLPGREHGPRATDTRIGHLHVHIVSSGGCLGPAHVPSNRVETGRFTHTQELLWRA